MALTLLDGGMGQELLKRSGRAATPLWSADIMRHYPGLVRDLHCDFIMSGAQVITLNTYAATPERLSKNNALDAMEDLHKQAIQAAQDALEMAHSLADGSDVRDIKIAGCLPPLVASYHPEVSPKYDDALQSYRRIVALQDDGCDLLICETMSSIDDARAALIAGQESGKPVWVAFTVDEDDPDCLYSGEPLAQAISAVNDMGADAILLNCNGPEVISQAMAQLMHLNCPFGAYANAFESVKPLRPGGTVEGLQARQDISPDQYVQYAQKWQGDGASIIGGCCEITPSYIDALRRSLSR